MAWFIEWFNSPYYHLLYRHRDQEEASAFINNLLTILKPAPDARFLDLACGNGRHANYIGSMNFHITGIDLSPENIILAQKNKNKHAEFFVHDMRNYFRSNYYDYVLNLFTSFGYFDSGHDELRAMKMAAGSLKKNGKMLIDFFNADLVSNCLVPTEEKIIDKVVFRINKKIEHDYIIKTIEVIDREKKFQFSEKVKMLNQQNFEQLFEKSGLSLCQTFGDYQLNPYRSSDSERLILMAEKR